MTCWVILLYVFCLTRHTDVTTLSHGRANVDTSELFCPTLSKYPTIKSTHTLMLRKGCWSSTARRAEVCFFYRNYISVLFSCLINCCTAEGTNPLKAPLPGVLPSRPLPEMTEFCRSLITRRFLRRGQLSLASSTTLGTKNGKCQRV